MTIAIIDDDVGVRNATSRLVDSLGYSTATYASAEEFLRSSRQEVRCVISDVQMPGMSGLVLQERLKAEDHHLPVILITGFPESCLRERALSAGAQKFLVKPYSQQSLASAIEAALRA